MRKIWKDFLQIRRFRHAITAHRQRWSLSRARICHVSVLLVALTPLFMSSDAYAAEDYPSARLTMIVPFPAGGRTDLVGRIVAQYLEAALGKSVTVFNRPGAGGILGSKDVAEASADGYTLGFFSSALVAAQYTMPNAASLADFELIAIVNADPAAIAVNATSKWHTLKDLIEDARKSPGKLTFGTVPGASAQIFAAGFERAADVSFLDVPFKGDSDGAAALAGGTIDAHAAVPVSYKSLVAANLVRVLAIASDSRSEFYADMPTFRENGVPLSIGSFHGVFVPKGTPDSVKAKIGAALKVALENPELRQRMDLAGAATVFFSGQQAQEFLAQQDKTYRNIIDTLGLRVAR
jgi:tripartite-type tricarboxylate transporter receptor subunit TctC